MVGCAESGPAPAAIDADAMAEARAANDAGTVDSRRGSPSKPPLGPGHGLPVPPLTLRDLRPWSPTIDVPPAAPSPPRFEPLAAEVPVPGPSEAPTFEAAVAALHFTEVTDAAGLDTYDCGHSVAWGDLDGDGWPDLAVPVVFSNVVAVYLNDHDGTFTKFNELPVGMNPLAVAIADYDGDGKPDLVACGGKSVTLFKATGGGYLWPEEEWAIPSPAICSMVGFVDLDGNGLLDVYTAISHGVASMPPAIVEWCDAPCTVPAPPPPGEAGKNRVLLQQPGGAFIDATATSPLADPWRTLAFSVGHWLAGGGLALFVGNDTNANGLFALPLAPDAPNLLCAAGTTDCLATMGVAPADVDGDGHLDIVATDVGGQHVYRSQGDGTFENASEALGVAAATTGDTGWGAVAADFDNDGDLDLAFGDQPEEGGSKTPQRPAFLLHHAGTFTKLGATQGFPWLKDVQETYGVQTADYDRDGDLDLVWTEKYGRLWLFRNDSVTPGHWLRVRLHGAPPNTTGLQSLVRVTTGWTVQVQEGPGVTGASGQNDPALHFGLGSAPVVDKVVVTFASGKIRSFGPVAVDQEIDVVEP